MAKLTESIISSLQEEREKAKYDQLSKLSMCSEDMRKKRILTDVTLVCGGHELAAHRLVLAASSSYFQSMFSNGLEDMVTQKVDLPAVDGSTMETILDFLYTGNINIPLDNQDAIKDLLDAADKLQVGIVFNYCYILLLKMLSKNRFLELWATANKYNNVDMKLQVITYIAKYFSETSSATEFVQLPLEVLSSVLMNEEIRNHNADTILKAVFQWIKHETEREKDLPLLLSCVNFQDLSDSYLLQIIDNEPLMNNSMELMRILIKTIASRYLENLVLVSSLKGSMETQPTLVSIPQTVLSSGNQRLFAFKVSDSEEGVQYKWYYPESGKESTVVIGGACLMFESAVCELDGVVYFIGGKTKSLQVNGTVLAFDITTLIESNPTSLLEPRYAAGAVASDDFIYVAGGINADNAVIDSVERYDVFRDLWQKVASMNARREKPSMAFYRDKVYVVSMLREAMQSPLEYYTAYVNQWTMILLEDSLLTNFKQGKCFIASQSDIIYILIQSSKNIHIYIKRNESQIFQHIATKSTSEILTFASTKLAGTPILLIVNTNGNIQKYNDHDCSWKIIHNLLENTTYAVSVGMNNTF